MKVRLAGMFIILLQWPVYSFQQTADAPCQDGMYRYNASCYYFNSTQVDHATATATCSGQGAHLVFFETEDEETFVVGKIDELAQTGSDFWIGATVDAQGDPIWMDGSNMIYTNFEGTASFNDGGECIRLAYSGSNLGYTWHDRDCGVQLYGVICEKEDNSLNDCNVGDLQGLGYRGNLSTTVSGFTCQKWTEQTPHAHTRTPQNYPDTGLGDHNFCRNPDIDKGAWCYTTDPNKRLEFCAIGLKNPNCPLVRLQGANSTSEGRVEVFSNGAWGTVCDDVWSIEDAHVVCRNLGFPAAEAAVSNAAFGQGTGDILLDNVLCTGTEPSIFYCTHNGIGIHNCGHFEDAGVRCIPLGTTTEPPPQPAPQSAFPSGYYAIDAHGKTLKDSAVIEQSSDSSVVRCAARCQRAGCLFFTFKPHHQSQRGDCLIGPATHLDASHFENLIDARTYRQVSLN